LILSRPASNAIADLTEAYAAARPPVIVVSSFVDFPSESVFFSNRCKDCSTEDIAGLAWSFPPITKSMPLLIRSASLIARPESGFLHALAFPAN
jgi:hypothetical protein